MSKYFWTLLGVVICANEIIAIPHRIESGWWFFVVLGIANLIIWPCLVVYRWRLK